MTPHGAIRPIRLIRQIRITIEPGCMAERQLTQLRSKIHESALGFRTADVDRDRAPPALIESQYG
jgi:hypothetical protein